jgi:hypothetical protein
VPTEVLATPRATQQIAGLDRTHAKAFSEFVDDLAARGCKALGCLRIEQKYPAGVSAAKFPPGSSPVSGRHEAAHTAERSLPRFVLPAVAE